MINAVHDAGGGMEREEFDLIAVGRALLSDPQWVAKVEQRRSCGLEGGRYRCLGRTGVVQARQQ